MAFNPARIPASLKSAYQAGRCAVLVGAGASRGAGLPLWGGLLEEMIKAVEAEGRITAERAAEYRGLLTKSDKFLMLAAALKVDLGDGFDETIENIFIKPRPKPTALHRELTALDKLSFVVTINYDTLIEDAYQEGGKKVAVSTFVDEGDVHRRLFKREFFLLKAHGDAARVGNGIVLTDVDYRQILYRSPGYRALLSAIFTMFPVVFVGASMADPEINLLLGYIADSFSTTSGPRHYALLAKEDITVVEKERWASDFKVQIIEVSKEDNYAEVTQFLEELGKV